MSTTEGLIVLVAVLIIAGAGWAFLQWRRRRHLASRFGSEYERTVDQVGNRSTAERALKEREERVAALDIRPLDPQDRERYSAAWRQVQARFVDEPARAIEDADELIREVMQRRGYPVGDFERRAEDLSVDHPEVVQHYRAGHDLLQRRRESGDSTEDLRQAMVHYRALFDELVGDTPSRQPGNSGPRRRARTGREVNVERAE
jgi:hypothetical protein